MAQGLAMIRGEKHLMLLGRCPIMFEEDLDLVFTDSKTKVEEGVIRFTHRRSYWRALPEERPHIGCRRKLSGRGQC